MSGILIAIEGIDGSGKGTQANMLRDKLKLEGYKVELLSFPNYNSPFGIIIGEYLNSNRNIDPKHMATLYASDRLCSLKHIKHLLDNDYIVICDRYVLSNQVYQTIKQLNKSNDNIFNWIDELEYVVHGLPKPDVTFLMHTEVYIASILIEKKNKRNYTDKTHDSYESDKLLLAQARELYYNHFTSPMNNGLEIINCIDGVSELRDLCDINDEIYRYVKQRFLNS